MYPTTPTATSCKISFYHSPRQAEDLTYRRSLNNSDGLDNLLLVHLGTRTVKVTDNGGHTGLVAHGGGQVDGLLGVILGETITTFSLFLPIRILGFDC
jgi:hypothetical protein